MPSAVARLVGHQPAQEDEAIGALRQLWTGETVSFRGKFTAFEDVRICPPPSQRGGPPVIVGGRSDAAWKRAARLGDGWLPFLVSARRYREQAERLREEAETQGRALDGFHWMTEVVVALGPNLREARHVAMDEMAARDHPLPEGLFDKLCAVGPAEAVAETLQSYLDAGAEHLVLVATPQRDTVRMAETIATDVLPRLNSAAAGSLFAAAGRTAAVPVRATPRPPGQA